MAFIDSKNLQPMQGLALALADVLSISRALRAMNWRRPCLSRDQREILTAARNLTNVGRRSQIGESIQLQFKERNMNEKLDLIDMGEAVVETREPSFPIDLDDQGFLFG